MRQAKIVASSRGYWESLKEDATTARKAWEKETAKLEALIYEHDMRAQALRAPRLPFLPGDGLRDGDTLHIETEYRTEPTR